MSLSFHDGHHSRGGHHPRDEECKNWKKRIYWYGREPHEPNERAVTYTWAGTQ